MRFIQALQIWLGDTMKDSITQQFPVIIIVLSFGQITIVKAIMIMSDLIMNVPFPIQLRQTVYQFVQKELAPKADEIDKTNDFKEMKV